MRLYENIEWQPGELKHQGIIGSPDGYGEYEGRGAREDYELTIEEFKYTHKSSRGDDKTPDSIKNPCDDWLWRNQILCYMAMHPAKPTLVRWHVCYGNGNYVYPLTEKYIRYLCQAERAEIDNCWRMVVKNKFIV